MSETKRGNRRIKRGVVVSNKMEKTVVVKVSRTFRHPKYSKVVTTHKRYYAHDPSNETAVGSEVSIMEVRPMSKTKSWLIVTGEASQEQAQ